MGTAASADAPICTRASASASAGVNTGGPRSTDDVYAGWPQIAYLSANVLAILIIMNTNGSLDDMRVHDGRITWTSPRYRAWMRRLRMAVASACLGIVEYEHAHGTTNAYRRKPLPARPCDDYTSVQMYVLLHLWDLLFVSSTEWARFIITRNDALLRRMYGFVDAMVRCNDVHIREMRRYVDARGKLECADVGDDEVVLVRATARDCACVRRIRVGA